MIEQIKTIVEAETSDMIELRRELHRHPEISFHEDRTAEALCRILTELDIPYRRAGGRGIVAHLKGTRPGPNIAFRADFDALAIQEETGLAFASVEAGKMHACGHDAHTAVLVGLARSMAKHRELLCGTVTFIFQDAEETPPGGAAPMVDDGCLDGVDKIYGLHVSDELDTGVVGVCEGKYMAASDTFEITFAGKGGHGSRPCDGDDTISAMALAICTINAIPSRFLPAYRDAVITVCSVNGGNSYNVLPTKCTLMGTVRTFESETAQAIKPLIERCAQNAAGLFHTTYEYCYHEGYPVLVNAEVPCQTVRSAARLLGQKCMTIPPTAVAEDFSIYLQNVPGAFFRIGIRNPAKDAVYSLHSGKFNIDEEALPAALMMFWCIYLLETEQIHAQPDCGRDD